VKGSPLTPARLRRRPLLALTLAVALLGITTVTAMIITSDPGPFNGATTGDPPRAAPSPTASAEADFAGCLPIDLILPSGERLDLTGTWVGGSTIHHVRQAGDCVWWVGISDLPSEAPGESWLNSFQGHLTSDFTLSGIWADVYTVVSGSLHEGRTTYRIVIGVDGADSIVLEQDDTLPDEHGIYLRDYYADRLVPLVPAPTLRRVVMRIDF